MNPNALQSPQADSDAVNWSIPTLSTNTVTQRLMPIPTPEPHPATVTKMRVESVTKGNTVKIFLMNFFSG